MPATIFAVLRALIDAAFSSGGINDATHTDLHAQLNAVDPAHAEAEAAAQQAADAEAADRAAFEAWKANQATAGTEGAGFGG